MAFEAQKEITKVWGDLHSAQSEIGKTYFRWRQAALQVAGPNANPIDISVKAAQIIGKELRKASLPRLNWLKGEEVWMRSLAGGIAAQWIMQGAIVRVEKSEKPNEIFIKWERCTWPT